MSEKPKALSESVVFSIDFTAEDFQECAECSIGRRLTEDELQKLVKNYQPEKNEFVEWVLMGDVASVLDDLGII